MSYKFDSLITILNKLDRGESITVHSLMDELEVSERTVHRYLQTLEVAGFPIHFDRVRSSYRFVQGFNLRKPNLTIEEQLAFALAQSALKNFGAGMEDSLESIASKLAITQKPINNHIILKPERPSSAVEGVLQKIHHACINFQSVEIHYKSLYTHEETIRTIDPHYFFYADGSWMLRAFCHLRNEMRTFALDRILALKKLGDYFLPRKVTPEDELSSTFGVWIGGRVYNIVLHFDKDCAPYISRKMWHSSQEEKTLPNGNLEVRFKVNGLHDIKHWPTAGCLM